MSKVVSDLSEEARILLSHVLGRRLRVFEDDSNRTRAEKELTRVVKILFGSQLEIPMRSIVFKATNGQYSDAMLDLCLIALYKLGGSLCDRLQKVEDEFLEAMQSLNIPSPYKSFNFTNSIRATFSHSNLHEAMALMAGRLLPFPEKEFLTESWDAQVEIRKLARQHIASQITNNDKIAIGNSITANFAFAAKALSGMDSLLAKGLSDRAERLVLESIKSIGKDKSLDHLRPYGIDDDRVECALLESKARLAPVEYLMQNASLVFREFNEVQDSDMLEQLSSFIDDLDSWLDTDK